MATYKLMRDEISQEVTQVKKVTGSDSYTIIPMSEGNTDYQEYLEWVALGNTPEPANE